MASDESSNPGYNRGTLAHKRQIQMYTNCTISRTASEAPCASASTATPFRKTSDATRARSESVSTTILFAGSNAPCAPHSRASTWIPHASYAQGATKRAASVSCNGRLNRLTAALLRHVFVEFYRKVLMNFAPYVYVTCQHGSTI